MTFARYFELGEDVVSYKSCFLWLFNLPGCSGISLFELEASNGEDGVGVRVGASGVRVMGMVLAGIVSAVGLRLRVHLRRGDRELDDELGL